MNRKFWKDSRGIAIMITITVITLLIAMVLELNRRASDAAEYTAVARDRLTLSYMNSSGIHMAMALLLKDKKDAGEVDSIQEEWASEESVSDALAEIPFEDGTLSVAIQDEKAKIQVNALVKFPEGRVFNQDQMNMWERFLGYITSPDNEDDDATPSAIINSVKDWLDSGDDDAITGVNGAESDFYENLDPSYKCRNGPMTHIGELLLVKGVPSLVDSVGGWDAISNYISAAGMETETESNKFTFPGEININTAELPVIAALLHMDDVHLAPEIVAYREEMSEGNYTHDLARADWYKNAPGCSELNIEPKLLTTKSDFFRITASAELHGVKMVTVAVVQRENKSGKNRCKVLSWQTE
jgi:general secretion pathway protein K